METLFEKFNIISCLKKTEFSAVYLADHIFLEKRIILKTLDSEKSVDDGDLSRFKREAQILAKLNHPNIIRILDFGTFQNFVYISFEYFPARTIREIINDKQVTNAQRTDLLQQAAKGLAYAHLNKIIHRDIKPENILVDNNLQLKIADFGLALSSESSLVTDPASVMGTPAYMSPEQVSGKEISPASDLFSLGLLAYELFNKNNPLLGADIGQTVNNILNFNTPKYNELLGKCAETEKNIIKNLLHPDPDKRHIPNELIKEEEKIVHNNQNRRLPKALWFAIPAITLALFLLFSEYAQNPLLLQENTTINGQDKVAQENQRKTEKQISDRAAETKLNQPTKKKDQNRIVTANLQKTTASLIIESIPEADIFINSQSHGNTLESESINLQAGLYMLTLKSDDFPDYQQNIELIGGEQTQLSINLIEQSGLLKVFAYPWAEVKINDKKFGQTPFEKPIRLNKGAYAIELRNPGFDVYKKSFEINGNDTILVQHNFNE